MKLFLIGLLGIVLVLAALTVSGWLPGVLRHLRHGGGHLRVTTGPAEGWVRPVGSMILAEEEAFSLLSGYPADGWEDAGWTRPSAWREQTAACLLYTSPSPRDPKTSRMPSSA